MKNWFISFFILLPTILFAEADPEKMPKSGTLAASSNFPPEQGTQDGPWGGINLENDTPNPLSASLRRIDSGQFEYTVKNNSEDYYSASLDLISKDAEGRLLKKTGSFVSLQAGASVSRKLRVSSNTANVSVEIRDWKRKAKALSKEEAIAKIETKKEEIKNLESTIVVSQE